MYGGEPQAVPLGVVENLIAATDDQGNVRFDFHLKEGDAVKVTAGPSPTSSVNLSVSMTTAECAYFWKF